MQICNKHTTNKNQTFSLAINLSRFLKDFSEKNKHENGMEV